MQSSLQRPPSARGASAGGLGSALLACLAVALPTLIAFNLPPSATFFNQAAALIGWGAWLMWLAASLERDAGWPPSGALAALQGALAILLAAALASPLWTGLPWSLALSFAGMILAAALVAWTGAALQRTGRGEAAFRALCVGLVVAGLACSAIAFVQVFAPQWADGDWIARSASPGRAVGNMRQPNHLSSLLLWGVIAALWLGEAWAPRPAPGRTPLPPRPGARAAMAAIALLFLFSVVLTASRTGALGTVLLLAWGVLDRRLSRPARVLLCAMPLAYFLFWLGLSAWADATQHVFGGATRFSVEGNVSSSRFAIWRNTLTLIAMHPWAGVGFGEFNFAWTLTPFPHRPREFFDHTHNLLLQFAVELGLPLATLVLALMGWALVRAVCNARRAGGPAGSAEARLPSGADERAVAAGDGAAPVAPSQRAALMLVLMVLLHSLLEYPLWYAYFLLPAAFAFGLCLDVPHKAPAGGTDRLRRGRAAASAGRLAKAGRAAQAATPQGERTRPLLLAAMLFVAGGFAALYDYMGVVAIFAPPAHAAPLAQRIVDGRHSWFFAHHANYAAATVVDHPSEVMAAFRSAPHYLLDTRLMIAWAKALDEAGDTGRARYLAQRLAEFHNAGAAEFFAPCKAAHAPGARLPFQCTKPSRAFSYEDFR